MFHEDISGDHIAGLRKGMNINLSIIGAFAEVFVIYFIYVVLLAISTHQNPN